MRPPRSLIRPQIVARLQQLARDGAKTTEVLQDPAPLVTFVRRNASGQWTPVIADEELISVRMLNRDAQTRGVNAGPVETVMDGELRGWAPLPIQINDRFTWQGHVFEIVGPPVERSGTVRARFELRARN